MASGGGGWRQGLGWGQQRTYLHLLGGAKLEAWARGGEEGGARLRRKLVLMELEISADWTLEVRYHHLAIVFILEIDAAPAHPGLDMGGRGEGGDKTLPQSY